MVVKKSPVTVGNYIDCQEICRWMTILRCKYYNFYTNNFQGQFHGGNCVLFREKLGRIPMKNVISASVEPNILFG